MTILAKITARLSFSIQREERLTYFLMVAWLLTMIALPIARWVQGDGVIPLGVTISALLQAATVAAALWQSWGARRTVLTIIALVVVTWSAEFIGSTTGFPFGHYHYTDVLQPQIGGVPLLVPLAWFMLLPSAGVMAQFIVGDGNTWQSRLAFIIVSAISMTAWDLFLDPQMVGWGFWVWEQAGEYFGIPLVNYGGWLLTAAIATLIAHPAPLKPMPLALVYAVVWFLQSVGQAVFWGQVGPAFFGCLAMGSIMLLAYWRQKARRI